MEKYPALRLIGFLMRLAGYICLMIGLGYYVIYEGIIEPLQPGHHFGAGDIVDLLTGGGLTLTGIFTLAFGEIVKVFIDIERNTRKA